MLWIQGCDTIRALRKTLTIVNSCCFCLQEHGSEEITIVNPAQFPDRSVVSEYLEPMVLGTILAPESYTGKIMSLCSVRGRDKKTKSG